MNSRPFLAAVVILISAAILPHWSQSSSPRKLKDETWVGVTTKDGRRVLTSDLGRIKKVLQKCPADNPIHVGDELVLSDAPCIAQVRELPAEIRIQLGLPLHLNLAPLSDLTLIDGVGPKRAQAIVDARPYSKFEDLDRAHGIGPKQRERLRSVLTLDLPTRLDLLSSSEM